MLPETAPRRGRPPLDPSGTWRVTCSLPVWLYEALCREARERDDMDVSEVIRERITASQNRQKGIVSVR